MGRFFAGYSARSQRGARRPILTQLTLFLLRPLRSTTMSMRSDTDFTDTGVRRAVGSMLARFQGRVAHRVDTATKDALFERKMRRELASRARLGHPYERSPPRPHRDISISAVRRFARWAPFALLPAGGLPLPCACHPSGCTLWHRTARFRAQALTCSALSTLDKI